MSKASPSEVRSIMSGKGGFNWSFAALLLVAVGLYLLLHPYRGLIQDARLYTLLALNRLHPDLYGNDIFLRFGSQDSYTVFSPFYAWLISLLNVETAASLVTGLSTVVFFGAAWWLARTLMPARFAWLAIGLLVALPGVYGSNLTLSILEQFVTPRLLAEGLVLVAIAAWLRERRALAATVLLFSFLIHPIMTFPGLVVLMTLGWGFAHWRSFAATSLVALLAAGVLLLGWLPIASWQFDPAWQEAMGYGSYLRLANWSQQEWAAVGKILATLGCAALVLDSTSRRLAIAMILACSTLLLLAWIGGELLQIRLVYQGQAWRVLWLATTIATILLPCIANAAWQGSALHRCGLLLLATSWMFEGRTAAPVFAAAACVAMGSRVPLSVRQARMVLAGTTILSIVLLACGLAVAWNDFSSSGGQDTNPVWIDRLRSASMNGLLPCIALTCVWFAATRIRSRTGLACLTVALLAPVAVIASSAVTPWKTHVYTEQTKQSLAAWRALIPQGTEVIWAADLLPLGDPLGAWMLLERPSYFSAAQSATGLFSRAAALEFRRRTYSLPPSLPVEYPYKIVPTGPAGLGPGCGEIPGRYIVTQVLIPDARMIPAPAGVGPPFNKLKFYICP